MVDAGELRDAADSAKNSRPMGWAARAGLAARGVVYIIMGLLAVLVAMGAKAHIDQRGALTEVLAQPFGTFLVVLLAVGFACYALWRISEAILGVTGEPDGAGPRLKSLARGLAYAGAHLDRRLAPAGRARDASRQAEQPGRRRHGPACGQMGARAGRTGDRGRGRDAHPRGLERPVPALLRASARRVAEGGDLVGSGWHGGTRCGLRHRRMARCAGRREC